MKKMSQPLLNEVRFPIDIDHEVQFRNHGSQPLLNEVRFPIHLQPQSRTQKSQPLLNEVRFPISELLETAQRIVQVATPSK